MARYTEVRPWFDIACNSVGIIIKPNLRSLKDQFIIFKDYKTSNVFTVMNVKGCSDDFMVRKLFKILDLGAVASLRDIYLPGEEFTNVLSSSRAHAQIFFDESNAFHRKSQGFEKRKNLVTTISEIKTVNIIRIIDGDKDMLIQSRPDVRLTEYLAGRVLHQKEMTEETLASYNKVSRLRAQSIIIKLNGLLEARSKR